MAKAPTQASSSWLYLFSSNARELYIADIVDVAAALPGSHFHFRYQEKHVPAALRSAWRADQLHQRVAVHFLLQHPGGYHPDVALPVRAGTVVRTFVEETIFMVQFRVEEYLSLPEVVSAKLQGPLVQGYTQALYNHVADHPGSGSYVASGPTPPPPAELAELEAAAFSRLVTFLGPALSFSPRVFFRAARLYRRDDPVSGDVDVLDGRAQLVAGTDYILTLVHHQVTQDLDSYFEVDVPAGVRVLGPARPRARGRYDVIEVELSVAHRDAPLAASVRISLADGVSGAQIQLPVDICTTRTHDMSGPLLAAGGTAALALPPVLASGAHTGGRIAVVLAGAGAVGLAASWRRFRGLS